MYGYLCVYILFFVEIVFKIVLLIFNRLLLKFSLLNYWCSLSVLDMVILYYMLILFKGFYDCVVFIFVEVFLRYKFFYRFEFFWKCFG